MCHSHLYLSVRKLKATEESVATPELQILQAALQPRLFNL